MRRMFAFVVSLCLAAAASPLAAGSAGRWRVDLQFSDTSTIVRFLLDQAEQSLQDDQCRLVFSDFRDQNGRPLTERLAELNVDGPRFLHWIMWYEGNGLPQCIREDQLAFTERGSRVVFICSERFKRIGFLNPDLGRAILIHEALHSLGLGENPPTTHEITRQVRSRCDRALARIRTRP